MRNPSRALHRSVRTAALILAAAAIVTAPASGVEAAEGKKPAKPGAAGAQQPANPWKARKYSSDLVKDAIAFYDQGEYDKAMSVFVQAERDPKLNKQDRLLVLKYEAFIYIMTGREDHAKARIETIYFIDPDFALAETDLAYFKKYFVSQKKAPETAKGEATAPPPHLAELLRKARANYDNGEYDTAAGQFAKAEQDPKIDREGKLTALKYQAFVFIMLGKEDDARRKIEAIYTVDPGFELAAADLSYFKTFFANVKKALAAKAKPAEPPATAHAKETAAAAPGGQTAVRGTATAAERRPNLFVRFWPSWTCLIAGAGAVAPGVYFGLTSTADRSKLKDAPKDQNGRLVGISNAEMQKMQDDAHTKALMANILMGAGGALAATGVVMFFVYDGADKAPPVTFETLERGGAIRLSLTF